MAEAGSQQEFSGVMTVHPKAIETRYMGYRFRSRLEARWAVYFQTLGCDWDYELEGYDLGSAGLYLPDFWLKTVNMWAEVKPEPLVEKERAKCQALVLATGHPCIMLIGIPEAKPYYVYEPCHAMLDPSDIHDQSCCNGKGWICTDLLMTEEYLHSENRFFWCPGGDEDPWPQQMAAIHAARSARFEHGENGTIR